MEKTVYQILQDWHELLKNGLITEEEFAVKKKELLGGETEIQILLPQEKTNILSKEEQPDSDYEILINNKSRFNKKWIWGLSIAVLFGVTFWYFSNNSKSYNNSYKSDSKPADISNAYYITKATNSNFTYFYKKAEINTRKSSYFAERETVYVQKIDNDFGYIKFTNKRGKTSKGWIRMQELQYCSNCGSK